MAFDRVDLPEPLCRSRISYYSLQATKREVAREKPRDNKRRLCFESIHAERHFRASSFSELQNMYSSSAIGEEWQGREKLDAIMKKHVCFPSTGLDVFTSQADVDRRREQKETSKESNSHDTNENQHPLQRKSRSRSTFSALRLTLRLCSRSSETAYSP